MPYVITTTDPHHGTALHGLATSPPDPTTTTLAVATLDEETLRQRCLRAQPSMIFSAEMKEQIRRVVAESGGSVGPLPDGTLIEVDEVTCKALFDALPESDRARLLNLYGNSLWAESPENAAILVHNFNAAQAVAA
jgi:hypothetical protein